MNHKYGEFSQEQFESYKKKLHSEIHWLLIYKDPSKSSNFNNIDFDKYFIGLMKRLNGLNRILMFPSEMVSIMASLEAAHEETEKDDFNFSSYRKLILDAHAMVDKIGR